MNRTPCELAIAPNYQKQLERADKRKSNIFFEKYVEPRLYSREHGWHIPFFDRKEGTFSQNPLERLITQAEGIDPANILPSAQLFTNALKFADFDPTKQVKGKSSGATAPKLRVINSGMMIMTFEHDGNGPESLQQQLDWFAGKPEDCLFSRVHKALSKFADYRGYIVVFSGHKSLHIHIIWDTTHLSKELTKSDNGPKNYWSMDVPDAALAPLHRMGWTEVAGIIQSKLNVDLEFDLNVSTYYAKRRSPWGTRIIDKTDNIHGFKVGDRVEQIVVQERVLTRAVPGAETVLLSADKISIALEHTSRSQNRPSKTPMMFGEEVELLDELSKYLAENGWAEYPKPVVLKFQEPSNALYFKNHDGDNNPNTFVGGSYRTILPAGVGAPSGLTPLPNDLTLDETLEVCRQRIAAKNNQTMSLPNTTKRRPQKWSKRYADDAIGVDQSRKLQGKMLAHVPDFRGTTLIQGLPGSGKTYSLMKNIQERRWDDDAERFAHERELSRGFIAIASPSYEQAATKRREFLNLNSGSSCAIVMQSSSQLYKLAVEYLKKTELDRREIGKAGFSNFLDGVRALQPDVFRKMVEQRDAMWTKNGKTLFHLNHTIVFTTGELIKYWPNSRISKAFLHPEFPEDYTEEDVTRCCQQMSFYRVIYDEMVTDDLVSIHPAKLVDIARDIRKHHDRNTGKPWDESNLLDQVNAYEHVMSSYSGLEFDFDDCTNIIRIKYKKKKDRCAVDAKQFTFGKGNTDKNIYAQRHGKEYYLKTRQWWKFLGCPVIILTTEDLPRTIFGKIDHGEYQTRSLSLMNAPYLFQEYVPVVFDERARSPREDAKPNCRDLAGELLSGNTDFVIGNKLKYLEPNAPTRTCSHMSAKGRNDLKSKSIATIITYPAIEQYDVWTVLGAAFNIANPIQLGVRDTVVQDVGRNTGFRRDPKTGFQPHRIYIKPSLYRDLDCFQGGSDIPFKFYNCAA